MSASANAMPPPAAQTALAEHLLGALPQTQCTRCGYPDCAAYAAAMAQAITPGAEGAAPLNQCPPGGAEGIRRLRAVFAAHGVTPMAASTPTPAPSPAPAPTPSPAPAASTAALPRLNPANGAEGPRAVAIIDEAWCIGCTLCIDACPTDAILGSNKLMHTVIEPHCTGCELCLPVCPVDCIAMENFTGVATGWAAWSQPQADAARNRYEFRSYRRTSGEGQRHKRQVEKLSEALEDLPGHSRIEDPALLETKRAVVEAALARARARVGGA